METRASYVLVGGFVFALFAAAMGFVIWIGKIELNKQVNTYRVDFTGSVTGLSVGSPVRFRGIPIGTVTRIRIAPGNLEAINVFVEIDPTVPIKQDSVAVLESQGLTGIGFIQIKGGTQAAPDLKPPPGETVAVIPSRASAVEEVFNTAPEIAGQLVVLINRASVFLKEENQRSFEDILKNLAVVTGAFAAREAEIRDLISNTSEASSGIKEMTATLQPAVTAIARDLSVLAEDSAQTLSTMRGTLGGIDAEVLRLGRDVHVSLGRFEAAAREAQELIAENRTGLQDFTQSGLYELTNFLVEGRLLLENLNRLTADLERDPAGVLFGSRKRGVETQQ